jgi:DNA-binding MarR family transcriptional regulator
MENTKLGDDRATMETLRNLYFSEGKAGLITSDIATATYLLLRKAEDHQIDDSAETIAKRLNLERKAVGVSLSRLEKAGYIILSKRAGKPMGMSINYENMPATRNLATAVTDDAKLVAGKYTQALDRYKLGSKRERQKKGWYPRQQVNAQKLLNYCDGDVDLCRKMIAHALGNPDLKLRAAQGLYHMWSIWKKVKESYAAKHPAVDVQVEAQQEATKEMVSA